MTAKTGRPPSNKTIRLAVRRSVSEFAGQIASKIAARALAGDVAAQGQYVELLKLTLAEKPADTPTADRG